MVAIFLYIVIFVLLGGLFYLVYKNISIKKNVLPTKSIYILRQILECSFIDESLSASTKNIINILTSYYHIDYCTIFVKNSRGLTAVSSNIVSGDMLNLIEKYCNDELSESFKADGKILCSDTKLNYPGAAKRNIHYMFYIPLIKGDTSLGALFIENTSRKSMEEFEQEFFGVVIENIAIVMQNFLYHDKLISMAYTDGLTGVANRVYITKRINDCIENERLFCLALLDIDHFKRFNDTYGHQTGDTCLKAVSKYINDNIRPTDVFARFGGEEFLLLITNAGSADIYGRIEELREGISNLLIQTETGSMTNVTASFGVAEYPANGKAMDEVLQAADKALYMSKESGRNRVTIYNA